MWCFLLLQPSWHYVLKTHLKEKKREREKRESSILMAEKRRKQKSEALLLLLRNWISLLLLCIKGTGVVSCSQNHRIRNKHHVYFFVTIYTPSHLRTHTNLWNSAQMPRREHILKHRYWRNAWMSDCQNNGGKKGLACELPTMALFHQTANNQNCPCRKLER